MKLNQKGAWFIDSDEIEKNNEPLVAPKGIGDCAVVSLQA
jgi:hypothetical protein